MAEITITPIEKKLPSEANLRKIISLISGSIPTASTDKPIKEYDSDIIYAKDDICIHELNLYRAKTATTGDWNPNAWEAIADTSNFAELDANGKILASQMPTSARQIVGYIDAENEHTLPDATTYAAGSEYIVSSNGYILQSTTFTLTAGNTLTEMEVAQANMLIAAGYVFTLTADTDLGTIASFAIDKVTLDDTTEIDLPYASDLTASSTPDGIQVPVMVGDEMIMIDGHWVHLSNTSYVTSVNGQTGAVTIDGGGTAETTSYEHENYPAWANVKNALDGIIAKIDYVKPSITSFVANPATTIYEVGQKISSIEFAWATNKDITTQSLTDCTLADATVRSATYDTEISANKTFTLTVGDGENTDSKSFSVAFRNKIYYGSATIPADYDSAFILGLSKSQFATGKNGSYGMTIGSGEYGYIAYPKAFGQISSVYIGGFETTVENCGDISFTNASGGVAEYNIIKTGRSGLGSISMEVK